MEFSLIRSLASRQLNHRRIQRKEILCWKFKSTDLKMWHVNLTQGQSSVISIQGATRGGTGGLCQCTRLLKTCFAGVQFAAVENGFCVGNSNFKLNLLFFSRNDIDKILEK